MPNMDQPKHLILVDKEATPAEQRRQFLQGILDGRARAKKLRENVTEESPKS